jgi:DNA polymerase elongation subunit (family B)
MSYIDAIYIKDKDLINVVERVDGVRKYKQFPAHYEFYYQDSKGKYTGLDGARLSKVAVASRKAFDKEKRVYGHKRLYESDIKPLNRCLERNYLNADAPALNKVFFDIEVAFDNKKGFADPSDPFNPITAISVYLGWLEKLVTLVIKPAKVPQDEAEVVVARFDDTILCSSEEEMLDMFLTLIDDADTISGWNSEGYDVPYTVNRTARLLGGDHVRRFCLWDQKPTRREYEKYGKIAETFDFVGRVHLDYLELYRKYTYHELPSYRLDFVGEYELGETKVQYEGTLDQLYNNDFEKFIAYNRQDTLLLVKLDKKLQYLDLVNVLAHANTVTLRTTQGAVAVTDQAVINEAHSRGLIVPDRKRTEDSETQAAGAYVAYPKQGMHDWIGSMDLNSLYPSLIRSLNMSPETIIGQVRQQQTKSELKAWLAKGNAFADFWEGKFAVYEYEEIMAKNVAYDVVIDWENGTSTEMSAAQAYDLIFLQGKPWMITANGTIFTYEKQGVIPGLLERWYSERKDLQKKLKEAINAGDKVAEEYWDKRQLVKKINLNSAYGALLNAGSRFFDQRLGQSTTLAGRCVAKHMASQVNLMFTGDYNHVGESVIYGDTDSCYFSAYPVYKQQIEAGEITWNKDKVIELYDAIAEEVNATFPQFMNQAFNAPTNNGEIIKAGREVVASKGIFITKKRYAVLIYDKEGKRKDKDGKPGEVKAMGLDLKRADTPEYMQRFLEEILLMVLTDQTQDAVNDKINSFRTQFKDKPGWEKGTPKRVNNLTKHTEVFEKTGKCGVGHAMAAINWNRFRKAYGDNRSIEITDGMKVIVCKLKSNPMGITSIAYPIDEMRLPEWFTKEIPFDHGAMEQTIIDNKVDNLIGVLKWDLRESEQRNAFDLLFS